MTFVDDEVPEFDDKEIFTLTTKLKVECGLT
jgi:hypothetical protein